MTKKAIRKRRIHEECWNLDLSFLKWLDERLPVYLHDAGNYVDLTYELDGKELTQREIIETMISDVKYLRGDDLYEYPERMQRLMKYWSAVLPFMWW